jgi:hypothetical protein
LVPDLVPTPLTTRELQRILDFAGFFFSQSTIRPGRVWSRGVWDVDTDNALYAKLVDALGPTVTPETLESLELSDWQLWWMQRGFIGIRTILMNEWDPIGVRSAGKATEDEYDFYIWLIGDLLRLDAPGALEAHLAKIREQTMGLGPGNAKTKARDRASIARLTAWYAEEMSAFDTPPAR